MRRIFLAVLLTLAFVPALFADSFSFASGTVFYDNGPDAVLGAGSVQYSFATTGGVGVGGFSDVPTNCYFISPGSCNVGTTTEPFDIGDSLSTNAPGLSGQTLFEVGGITVNGAPINLPNEPGPATLTVTEPVIFSGSFSVCPQASDLDGCGGPILPYTFSANGSGFGLFQFSFFPINGAGTGFWTLTTAQYTLNPVPEPGSVILMGTGLLALITAFRVRHRMAATGCNRAVTFTG